MMWHSKIIRGDNTHKLKEHLTHVVLGIGVIAIGLWIMVNYCFFMLPPTVWTVITVLGVIAILAVLSGNKK